MSRRIWFILVLSSLTSACADDPLELLVDLRTDFVAGQEFDRVRVFVDPGGIAETDAMELSYLEGVRVAELAGLSAGDHVLVATLFSDGMPIVERTVRIDLRETTAITVLVSRDCQDVACDDERSCRAGECVPRQCSELAPELCPAPECASDSECPAASACATARCLAGACLYAAADAACGSGMWCSPDDGCIDPTGATQIVDGVVYDVAPGYVLDGPLMLDDATRSSLTDISQALAFPMPGSAFPPGPYLGLRGDPDAGVDPIVVRFESGGAVTFATSDGISGPDEHWAQIQFSDPASAWGDFLFVCSASTAAGDGVFTVDPTGAFAVFDAFNNCNGLVFDYDRSVADPGFDPLYVNEGSVEYVRYQPDTSRASLTTSVPRNGNGFEGYIPRAGRFLGAMYLATRGDPSPTDGIIIRVDEVEPWSMTTVAMDLDDPGRSGAFGNDGPLGDVFFLTAINEGELRAYEPDGTFSVIVGGLSGPNALAIDGDALWITERDTGQILRLRASPGG